MDWKRSALFAAIVATLAAAPFADAEARRRHNPLFWPFVAGAAVVGTAATIATAPLRAVAPPYYYPNYYSSYYYAPPAAYYAPNYSAGYYSSGYAAPGYYAAPAYYGASPYSTGY